MGEYSEAAPGKARAYNNYGVELSQAQQKYAEAIPYFKKAIAMDSKYPDPCNNLAVAYAAVNKIDEAIEALQQGIDVDPSYPEGYNNLAALYLKRKQYDEAEKALRLALRLRSYYGKAYFNLGRICRKRRARRERGSVLRTVAPKQLDDAFGFSMYAKASMALQKYDDAIFAYQLGMLSRMMRSQGLILAMPTSSSMPMMMQFASIKH